MAAQSVELDPIWRETVRCARDWNSFTDRSQPNVLNLPYPPRAMRADEIRLHFAKRRYGTRGQWLVWCLRGPLYLTRERRTKLWKVQPDLYLCQEAEREDEVEEWFERAGLEGARARTRTEMCQIIRDALSRTARPA